MVVKMKLKSGVVIQKVGDGYVAVVTGASRVNFNGMIKMNESAAFIAEQMQRETDEETIIAALLEHYEVSREDAEKSVKSVIANLSGVGLIE